jgi:uncharacterized protein YigE (DUF2233 family)
MFAPHRSLATFAGAALLTLALVAGCGRTAAPGAGPCTAHEFEGSVFTVCGYDAATQDLRLVSRGADGAFVRDFARLERLLGADSGKVRFAMNAGMFNDAGAPIGLYVEAGQQLHVLRLTDGPGNFHLKPNGVFLQENDGALRVENSEAYAARDAPPRWATQSGPMLVIDGALHPAFAADGDSRVVRNGVGVRDSNTAYFVISADPVSFGRFARFFRDQLGCANALFLDGLVSSLWIPASGRRDAHAPLGPLLVVLDD